MIYLYLTFQQLKKISNRRATKNFMKDKMTGRVRKFFKKLKLKSQDQKKSTIFFKSFQLNLPKMTFSGPLT